MRRVPLVVERVIALRVEYFGFGKEAVDVVIDRRRLDMDARVHVLLVLLVLFVVAHDGTFQLNSDERCDRPRLQSFSLPHAADEREQFAGRQLVDESGVEAVSPGLLEELEPLGKGAVDVAGGAFSSPSSSSSMMPTLLK